MMRAALLPAACAAACAAGCQAELPPLGHVVVFIDTDAPLPRAALAPVDEPQPLFDRVFLEVFPSGANEPCTHCIQTPDLTDERVREGASFVVRTEDSGAARIRARMYRLLVGIDLPPAPEAIVEVVAELPLQPEEGATEVTLFLPTDAVGFPIGTLEAPVPLTQGRPTPSRVGSWPSAQRVGCLAPPQPGEVCVPGGAFWMGHPLAPRLDATSVTPQRLVVVSPFYLDAHETTVAELRSAGIAADVAWSGSHAGTNGVDWCTYTPSPVAGFDNDALPVNCIAWATARAYCQSRGADLPTEAQLEYVGGGLASRVYVWGIDEPSCEDAVWGRGGAGVLETFTGVCRAPTDIGGPTAVTAPGEPPRSQRDYLELPTGVVTEIAGNVAEWTLDAYQELDQSCWVRSDSNVLVNPMCDAPSMQRTERGGVWYHAADLLRATFRTGASDPAAELGFRCARHAEPAAP